jgi:glycosyltransferase involved in cell wall biosynthesis
VCSSSWLTRDDKECTLCLERSSLSAIKHACYRDSRISTLPIAVATRKGIQSPLLNARAAHIFLNQQHLSVMRKYGFEGASTVLPNFLEVPRELPKPANDYLVFAGRTSHEKGYCQLIANFPEGVQLHVFGSGNCFQCELPERSNVVRHGNVASSKLSEYLTKARALILPSQNPEGYPTIVAEALSFGVPIILTERVAISSELVQEGVALTIPNQFTGPDILFAIAALRSDEERMRFKAHKYAIRVYSKNDWIKKIKEIYFGVLNGA